MTSQKSCVQSFCTSFTVKFTLMEVWRWHEQVAWAFQVCFPWKLPPLDPFVSKEVFCFLITICILVIQFGKLLFCPCTLFWWTKWGYLMVCFFHRNRLLPDHSHLLRTILLGYSQQQGTWTLCPSHLLFFLAAPFRGTEVSFCYWQWDAVLPNGLCIRNLPLPPQMLQHCFPASAIVTAQPWSSSWSVFCLFDVSFTLKKSAVKLPSSGTCLS